MQQDNHPIQDRPESLSFRTFSRIFFSLLAVFLPALLSAQNFPFQDGEELKYDIRYKYGLVVMKGGTANYRLDFTTFNKKQAVKSSLNFRTTAFFDKIYKMRDTLYSYASIPDLKPLYHHRTVNEGNTRFQEEMIVHKFGNSHTEVNIRRIRREELTIDTIIIANNRGYDLLNIFLFVRNLNYSTISLGDTYNLTTFIGKKKVNIILRYEGQAILERSQNLKYATRRFTVDIIDDVFTESKNAMEIWISDDANRLPLRLKAKLKIGAAEADLVSHNIQISR